MITHQSKIYHIASQQNLSSGFPNRSDSNWTVQPQKMAGALKVLIYEVEGLYYLCSENKGADPLGGNPTADLHLCFHLCKKQVFSRQGSFSVPKTWIMKTNTCVICLVSIDLITCWSLTNVSQHQLRKNL